MAVTTGFALYAALVVGYSLCGESYPTGRAWYCEQGGLESMWLLFLVTASISLFGPAVALVRGKQRWFWCLVAVPCIGIAIEAAATWTVAS